MLPDCAAGSQKLFETTEQTGSNNSKLFCYKSFAILDIGACYIQQEEEKDDERLAAYKGLLHGCVLLCQSMSSAMSFWRAARLFATRAKSVQRGSGGRVAERPTFLNAEIERMKKAYEIYNETPPKPFKLRSSGDLDVLLTRRYNKGAEDIQVKCALVFDPRGGPPDELFEDELENKIGREQKVVVNMTMTITKGGPQALEINVDCDRRGYIVNNIIYRENKNSKHDDEFFPAFWRIGPKLRSGFHNFLEQRGLDEIFACWVHDQMDDKAFKERLRLMEKINAFVESENENENEKRS